MLNFTYPSNTVQASLYFSCPSGITGAAGECNTYLPVTSNTNWSPLFTNTTASSLTVVPNYYVYTSDNPNFAHGVSASITVSPAQTTTTQTTPTTQTTTTSATPSAITTSFSVSSNSITLGQSITLTSTTNSGTNLSSAAIDESTDNNSWSSGAPCGYWSAPSSVTSHTISCSFTPPSAGTYYFRARGEDTTGALSPFINQTLTVLPSSSNGSTAYISVESLAKLLNALK